MNAAAAVVALTPPASLPDACGCDRAKGTQCWEHGRRTPGSAAYLQGLRASQGWPVCAQEVGR